MIRRQTPQRQQIYDAIEHLGHASMEKIVEYLLARKDKISLATVYRNLAVLVDDGRIRIVEMAGENVYEITERTRHYHFRCEHCGEIIDIDPQKVPLDYHHLEQPSHMQVTSADVLLHGTCPRCGNKQQHDPQKDPKEKKHEIQM